MAATATSDAQPKSSGLGRPERPDDEQYRNDLAAAEKELATATEQLVRSFKPTAPSQHLLHLYICYMRIGLSYLLG